MPLLKLPAGMDAAEMALFDVDALQRRRAPDDEAAHAHDSHLCELNIRPGIPPPLPCI